MGVERTATQLDQRIGARVRARRLELGMSQERLADLVGVTFQQVQKYEKGLNRVAASRLHAIATALEVSMTYFFEGAGRAKAEDVALEQALTRPDVMQLIKLYCAISAPKVRKRVLELVRAMAGE